MIKLAKKNKTSRVRSMEDMMSNADMVKIFIQQENWKSALKIAKNFRFEATAKQRSIMARAYECMVYPSFYKSLGKNIEDCIDAGKKILKEVVA